MNKKCFFASILLVLAIVILMILPRPLKEKTIFEEKELEQEKSEIKLYFVGDIMLNRGVLHYIEKNNNWQWPFLNIAEDFKKADLVFGNLESVISNKGRSLGGKYSFRAPPQVLEGLTYANFSVLSMANNHSFDYGVQALVDCLARLKRENILYVGAGIDKQEAHSAAVKEINGLKIGFLAYTNVGSSGWQATENTPGIAWIDILSLDVLTDDIKRAREKSDLLAVSFHFGEEYQKEPNENQKLLARSALKAGADIIVGHHSHVVQPLEKNEHGIIAYSLGNFIFDQYFSKETMSGAILKVIVKDKKIIEAALIETRLNSQYQAEITEKGF